MGRGFTGPTNYISRTSHGAARPFMVTPVTLIGTFAGTPVRIHVK